jgi:hypothetical protein
VDFNVGIERQLDSFRATRREIEASVLPLATSVDGRRFTFQASLYFSSPFLPTTPFASPPRAASSGSTCGNDQTYSRRRIQVRVRKPQTGGR